MQSIAEIESEIVEEFELFDDPMDRYQYIIDLGNKMVDLPEQFKTESNLVKGCQSQVWLQSDFEGGKMHFQADSNTVITKGIIALLVRVFDQQNASDIVSAKLDFIDRIQLREHLSSQRSNGLSAMIMRMQQEAKSHL
jgi:cysteine desulfuration protein SufE